MLHMLSSLCEARVCNLRACADLLVALNKPFPWIATNNFNLQV